jgi:hypothetical protein
MSRPRLLILLGVAFILLLLGGVGGVWWYLFGANEVEAAELVPGNSVFFATIPNALAILEGYETSRLKTLVESPNSGPLRDQFVNFIGQKNVELLLAFLPNLSGQSFIAVTHYDPNHPEHAGLIAAMKPKAGMKNFDAFLEKLKTTWPDLLKQAKTGTDSVVGVNYQWIQMPGAPEKICVAQFHGWIVTTWGEATLQDWLERFQKKSLTSNLADDPDYRNSLTRVGNNPMTLLYLNNHAVLDIVQKQVAKTNPQAADYLAKKLDTIGGAMMATRFENGEIVDRFSVVMPRPAQLESGMASDPCSFETLKFTGPNTRFYWASSINWKQYYKNLQDPSSPAATTNPAAGYLLNFLQTWAANAGLDVQHNIIDALGSELSVQAEWNPDATYPEVGLFVKLDKPEDFKPTITAIIESARKAYATTAVVNEINSSGQNFAALKFVQTSPITPTITEDGPYLGLFLSENQAVRSFQRDPTLDLTQNADFNRQIGDKRKGAAQVIFLDSPQLLDHAYRNAMPYLSIASMFNQNLAAAIKDRNLPPDLTWLAPMGTWSLVVTPDEEGIKAYSVSGIGNQGLFLGAAAGGSMTLLQTMGFLPKSASGPSTSFLPNMNPFSSDRHENTPPTRVNPTTPTSLYITSENKILFGNTPVDVNQIGDFLKTQKANSPGLKLIVKMDKDASPDVLSKVMDAGASAGFGVLPYVQTSDADSIPRTPTPLPSTPPSSSGDAGTNGTSTFTPTPMTNAPSPSPNTEAAPPVPGTATNSISTTNTNADATPPSPEPAKTQ